MSYFIPRVAPLRRIEDVLLHTSRCADTTHWEYLTSYLTLHRNDTLRTSCFIPRVAPIRYIENVLLHTSRCTDSTHWGRLISYLTLHRYDTLRMSQFMPHIAPIRHIEDILLHTSRCIDTTHWGCLTTNVSDTVNASPPYTLDIDDSGGNNSCSLSDVAECSIILDKNTPPSEFLPDCNTVYTSGDTRIFSHSHPLPLITEHKHPFWLKEPQIPMFF